MDASLLSGWLKCHSFNGKSKNVDDDDDGNGDDDENADGLMPDSGNKRPEEKK